MCPGCRILFPSLPASSQCLWTYCVLHISLNTICSHYHNMLHNKQTQNLKDTIHFISHVSRISWKMVRCFCFSWLGLFICQGWLAVSYWRLGGRWETYLYVFHPLQTSGPPPLVVARVQEREQVKIHKAYQGLDLELVCCHFYLILLAKANRWGI